MVTQSAGWLLIARRQTGHPDWLFRKPRSRAGTNEPSALAIEGMQILTAIVLAFCGETIYPWMKQSGVHSTGSTENIA